MTRFLLCSLDMRRRDRAVCAGPAALAAASREASLLVRLHARAIGAAAAALAAGADAALAIAGGALPARVARALALDACAVAAAGALALLGLAPLARPPRLAHAHAARRVAGAVPVAAVHASAVRPAVGAAGAVRIALARPVEAAPTAEARRLAPRPRGAHRVLAVGAGPPVVTRAEAAHLVADAVVTAAARAAYVALTRLAGEVRLAHALARHLRAADAAAVTVGGARALRAVGSRPAVGTDAHPPRGVAHAVRTAPLGGAAARAKRRDPRRRGGAVGGEAVVHHVAEGVAWALRRLAPRSTPPRVADAHAVVRAIAPAGAATRARALRAVGAAPPLKAHAPSGVDVRRLQALPVAGAIGRAKGNLARVARKGRLARAARGEAGAGGEADQAGAAVVARRRPRAGRALARAAAPAGQAAAVARARAPAVRRPAALVARGVERAAPLLAVDALPAAEARALAVGHAAAAARAPVRARGHLAVHAHPAVVAHAPREHR